MCRAQVYCSQELTYTIMKNTLIAIICAMMLAHTVPAGGMQRRATVVATENAPVVTTVAVQAADSAGKCRATDEYRRMVDTMDNGSCEKYDSGTEPYDQSEGMLVIEALSRAYGDRPDIAGGFIGSRKCPAFLEGMYFDGATLVLQVRGDTVRARRKLEADAGSKAFRIEKMTDGTFSQMQLSRLMDKINERYDKTDDSMLRDNMCGWGMGAKYIDVYFRLNTAEAQKAFREKILDSPAVRFHGPAFARPDNTTGVTDTLGVSLHPEYTAYSTDSPTASFVLINRGKDVIGCGEDYSVTFEDEHGTWRRLPNGGFFHSIAIGISPMNFRRITARLHPLVNHNRTGRYRLLYNVSIGQAKDIMMMTEFRLTSDSTELAGVTKTRIPAVVSGMDGPVNPEDTVSGYDYEASRIYEKADVMPSFPGGMDAMEEYIRSNLHVPDSSDYAVADGSVLVAFVVCEDGSLTDLKVLSGINPELDNEALRCVGNMPQWIPGMTDGRAVKVRFGIPLRFDHTQAGPSD